MAYPTANQVDEARDLAEIKGMPKRLMFLNGAYEKTHLSAYGLVFMEWEKEEGKHEVVILRPDGNHLDFDPRITL